MTDSADLSGEYRHLLEECAELYRSSGQECLDTAPELIPETGETFLARMMDLHRGLAVKVFVEIAHVDFRWSAQEISLAADLFEHVWGKRLSGDHLKAALEEVLAENSTLKWEALVGPFQRLAPLRARTAELQTLVVRMANLLAKADGRVKPAEVRQLQWIQAELRRQLEPLTLVASGAQVIAEVSGEAAEVRKHFHLEPAPAVKVRHRAQGEDVETALAELDQLVGMGTIKKEVRGLVNFLKVQAERVRFNLPKTPVSLHAVFSGNPGTGKTTVARLLGRIFGSMGLLTRGHLIETDRSGLVAEYAGQTGPKTHKQIDQALDGVLFIDEAYSLVAETGDDPYGAEAVQAMLKRMEDDRDRLVVVLAGYPEPMKTLVRSNPGLSSRFSRQFLFPDYSAGELGQIFQALCQKNHYELPSLTRVKLLLGFQFLLDNRDEHFGNGRLVRNTFERAIGSQANRIAAIAPLTKELLTTLLPEDIEFESVPEATWRDLDDEGRLFRTTCPGCGQSSRCPQKLLGHRVNCKRCGEGFRVEWGEVVPQEER